MILVRDVFRIKFGKAKDVKAAWKEAKSFMPGQENSRVLFDLVGPSYTMVMESTHKSLSDYEAQMAGMGNKEMQDWYHNKFALLIDSAYREIFTIVE